MAWLIVLLVILLVMCWLFLSPLEICINSTTHDYYLKWKGIGEARVLVVQEDLLFVLQIAFWKKQYSVMKVIATGKKEKKQEKKRKRKQSKISIRKIRPILNSFDIQKMKISIDTRNYVLNGYLFPIFFLMTRFFKEKPNLSINYKGKTEVNVLVRNRLINIFYALIRQAN